MNRNLLLLSMGVFCLSLQALQAQSDFRFQTTSYVGALGADPANDWTTGWTNWTPKTTAYAAPTDTTTLNGMLSTLPKPGVRNITNTLTLNATTVYRLTGLIVVREGGKLVIPAGTLIRCEANFASIPRNFATVVVERGGQIDIQGTLQSPVVFTSAKASGQRDRGDWGGISLCGRARNNFLDATLNNAQLEGFNTITDEPGLAFFGGTNDQDNSGSIRYCRIEFAGFAFQPNREVNGLTLASCGSATVLNSIQVSFCGDDSFEWFGGTVNGSNLIAYKGTDDDFDTDLGYTGLNQFGIAVRDTALFDLTWNAATLPSTSEGFESDNDGQGTANVFPRTRAVFSNFTMVGPIPAGSTYASRNSSTTRGAFRRGARIRRNSSQSIVNSIFMGYRNFVMIDGDSCVRNTNWPAAIATTTPNTPVPGIRQVYVANNLFVNTTAAFRPGANDTTANGLTEVANVRARARLAAIDAWLRQPGPLANNIDPVPFTASSLLVNPNAYSDTPNFRPVANSPALAGANFGNNPLLNGLTPIEEAELEVATVPVYPNPISLGMLNFGVIAKQFYLVNIEGEIVRFGKNTSQMPTDGLSKGMYFIVIDKTVQKVIVQ